jgi:hypothetical protein
MSTELDKRYINENPPELIVEEGDDNNAGLPRFTLVPAQGLSSSLKKKETKDG